MACKGKALRHRRDHVEPEPVEGARWIQLGLGRFTLVDADLFDTLNAQTWSYAKGYAKRVWSEGDGKIHHMNLHQRVLGLPVGWADHINGNKLDNRRCNLRPATPSQNGGNGRLQKHSSRFKGVYWHVGTKRWQAMCGSDLKTKYLGSFGDEEVAARTYDAAARARYGQFACLNFPMPGEQSAHRVITNI
jgi:hypothetical protein